MVKTTAPCCLSDTKQSCNALHGLKYAACTGPHQDNILDAMPHFGSNWRRRPSIMRNLLLSGIAAAILCVACTSMPEKHAPVQLLFVGNSLTYVGNLPAVLDALASSNDKAVQSDMIVKGGATLTERVLDGSVKRALDKRHYDYVVLQERGGDAVCAPEPTYCPSAEASLGALAHLALAHGAKPILLGGYQSNPQVSRQLVKAETAVTMRLSIAYISVSNRLLTAITSAPAADWLYPDRGHPGHDLVLLESVLLYRQLFGVSPVVKTFDVHAPMYTPHSKFTLPSPTSQGITATDVSSTYEYAANRVATASAIAAGESQ